MRSGIALGIYPAVAYAVCLSCVVIVASWAESLGFIHSQYWCTSWGVRLIGCGVDVEYALFVWHLGVGIHNFGGRGGGSLVCRIWALVFKIGLEITGRGSFGLFLALESLEFISAIFSSIGAILAELQSFLWFWACNFPFRACNLPLDSGIVAFTRGILGSIRDDPGLVLD